MFNDVFDIGEVFALYICTGTRVIDLIQVRCLKTETGI